MMPERGIEVARRPHRRLLLGVAFVLIAGLLLFGAASGFWLPGSQRYATVRSIEQDAMYRDPRLMAAAWRLPVARAYPRDTYEYQHNQSFCGPASVADVLHSVGDTRSQETIMAGTRYRTWFGFLPGGLTLDQLADLLRQRIGRPAIIERGLSLAQFRWELGRVNEPDRRMIVNFHRRPLFGRGHGHFSPLLAYLRAKDLVFVGDVNPSYRPFLVSSARLWRAVDTVDPATGRKRGLLKVTAR